MIGAIFRYDPNRAAAGQATANDSDLPWPHCPPIKTAWRNGVGMPVELIPGWTANQRNGRRAAR